MEGGEDAAGIRSERVEGVNNCRRRDGGKTLNPRIAGGDVYEQEGIAIAAKGEAVAIDYVHVHFIQVMSSFFDCLASRGLFDGCKVTKHLRERAGGE